MFQGPDRGLRMKYKYEKHSQLLAKVSTEKYYQSINLMVYFFVKGFSIIVRCRTKRCNQYLRLFQNHAQLFDLFVFDLIRSFQQSSPEVQEI